MPYAVMPSLAQSQYSLKIVTGLLSVALNQTHAPAGNRIGRQTAAYGSTQMADLVDWPLRGNERRSVARNVGHPLRFNNRRSQTEWGCGTAVPTKL